MWEIPSPGLQGYPSHQTSRSPHSHRMGRPMAQRQDFPILHHLRLLPGMDYCPSLLLKHRHLLVMDSRLNLRHPSKEAYPSLRVETSRAHRLVDPRVRHCYHQGRFGTRRSLAVLASGPE